jgi:ATP-binding cassette subfamily C (CFTR/MRP) protein 1
MLTTFNELTGDINNIMGVDVVEICDFIRFMTDMLAIPLAIGIGEYILWQQLGPSSLTLLAVMLIVGPFTTFVMTRIDTLQTKQMQLKDKRMEQISEVLSNIKLLKLFGWEKPFIDRISETRRQELHTLKLKNYFWSGIDVLWIVVPFITAGITFTIFIYTSGQPFTAKTAFVSLSVYISLKAPMGRYVILYLIIINDNLYKVFLNLLFYNFIIDFQRC